MDNEKNIRDYRQFIIQKWANADIESFQKPLETDLEYYSKYYKLIIDKFFPKDKSANILEIGCGWGGMVYALKKLGFQNIDGIDIIPECCNFIKERLGVDVGCMDVFQFFSQNNKKYDVIVAFDVIEHFSKNEIVLLMTKIFESLNNKGVFIMRSPNAGSPSGLYIRYSGFTHEIAFTSLSINELFRVIGFKKIYCIPEPEFSSNLIKVLIKRMVRKFVGRLLSLDSNFINSANIIGVGIKSDEK